MDPSSVFEQTTQDVSNLPAEFHHILGEIKCCDMELYDLRKKSSAKEAQMQKFIKQNGLAVENPKEKELSDRVREEFGLCQDLQRKKCRMANTALFLVSKHLAKLEKSVIILEEDGLLAPLEEEMDSSGEYSRENSVMSGNERRKRKTASAGTAVTGVKRRKQNRTSPTRSQDQDHDSQQPQATGHPLRQSSKQQGTPKDAMDGSPLPLVSRDANFDLQDNNDDLFAGLNNNEEEDKTLYCFCQSVSYGEMVACDGENCKFEWFHYSCVNLKEPPRGAWFCPDCRQQMNKRQ